MATRSDLGLVPGPDDGPAALTAFERAVLSAVERCCAAAGGAAVTSAAVLAELAKGSGAAGVTDMETLPGEVGFALSARGHAHGGLVALALSSVTTG